MSVRALGWGLTGLVDKKYSDMRKENKVLIQLDNISLKFMGVVQSSMSLNYEQQVQQLHSSPLYKWKEQKQVFPVFIPTA